MNCLHGRRMVAVASGIWNSKPPPPTLSSTPPSPPPLFGASAFNMEYKDMLEEAKKYDHRELTKKQELFFFHPLSPGSCFFLPHGSRVCNKLLEFMRNQYWTRGYEEVWTPNMYNMQLWETSGHAANYKENIVTCGTVESRSVVEPVRNIIRKKGVDMNYLKAECFKIDAANKKVHCCSNLSNNLNGEE